MQKYITEIRYYDMLKFQEKNGRKLLSVEGLNNENKWVPKPFNFKPFGKDTNALKVLSIDLETKKLVSIIYTDFEAIYETKNSIPTSEQEDYQKFMEQTFSGQNYFNHLHHKDILTSEPKETIYHKNGDKIEEIKDFENFSAQLNEASTKNKNLSYKQDCRNHFVQKTGVIQKDDKTVSIKQTFLM